MQPMSTASRHKHPARGFVLIDAATEDVLADIAEGPTDLAGDERTSKPTNASDDDWQLLGLNSLREEFIAHHLPAVRAFLERLRCELDDVERAVADVYTSPEIEPAEFYRLLQTAVDVTRDDYERMSREWSDTMRSFAMRVGPPLDRLIALRDLDAHLRAGAPSRRVEDRVGVVIDAARADELWNGRALRVWCALRREAERRMLRVLIRAEARKRAELPLDDEARKLAARFPREAERAFLAAVERRADPNALAFTRDRSEYVSVVAVRNELIDVHGAFNETGLTHPDVMAGVDAISEDLLRRDLWRGAPLANREELPPPMAQQHPRPDSSWAYLALLAATFVGQKVDDHNLTAIAAALRKRFYEKIG